MPVRCSVAVESRPSALEDSCREILLVLAARGFSQDDVFAVHLALEEAFLNAVKHGNRMDPTKKVTIEAADALDTDQEYREYLEKSVQEFIDTLKAHGAI